MVALLSRASRRLCFASVLGAARGMCMPARALQIAQFPCLSDNYGYLVHDAASGVTACVDTPEVAPIVAACERNGWSLTHILNTHHHGDHTGGNLELKKLYPGCEVIGPLNEASKIPAIDRPMGGGDIFELGDHTVHVIDVGGHTHGHIAYHFVDDEVAFVGDSLFALGCGRLFEGTPEQAWTSLQRLSALPPQTTVYCAHEYTEANLRFALTIEPANEALQARAKEVAALRSVGKPTVPTSIEYELATNPFLRPTSRLLREHIGAPDSETAVQTFARVRKMKDAF